MGGQGGGGGRELDLGKGCAGWWCKEVRNWGFAARSGCTDVEAGGKERNFLSKQEGRAKLSWAADGAEERAATRKEKFREFASARSELRGKKKKLFGARAQPWSFCSGPEVGPKYINNEKIRERRNAASKTETCAVRKGKGDQWLVLSLKSNAKDLLYALGGYSPDGLVLITGQGNQKS